MYVTDILTLQGMYLFRTDIYLAKYVITTCFNYIENKAYKFYFITEYKVHHTTKLDCIG